MFIVLFLWVMPRPSTNTMKISGAVLIQQNKRQTNVNIAFNAKKKIFTAT